MDEPMSLNEVCEPKEKSVDTCPTLLGVRSSNGPGEEEGPTAPEGLSPPLFLVAEKPGHANHLESLGDLNLTVTWHYSITLPWSLENLSELHAVNINIYGKPIMNSQSAGRTSRTCTHSAHQPMVRAIRVDSNIVVVGHVL